MSYWTNSKMLRSPASLLASHNLHSRQKQRGSGWKKKLVIATKKDWMVTTILQHVFSLVLFTATNIVDWMMMMIATTDMPMMTVAMAFIHDSFALCKIFVAGKQLKFLEPHGFILLWTGPSWMIIEQTCLALRVISSCVVTQNKWLWWSSDHSMAAISQIKAWCHPRFRETRVGELAFFWNSE